MDEINSIAKVTDPAAQKTAYEALIDNYMARPTFAATMLAFWQDQFKIGGTPDFDSAPSLAAELSFTDGSYMDLFTRTTNNCTTYNATANTFTDATCANGGPQSGVLSNPGVMASYTSNLAFRRVRWVQETFDCLRFPVEATGAPQDEGGASPYTGVWPFSSIASPTNGGGRVNFQDMTSAVCANCHETLNHRAPLFGNYDMAGKYQTAIAVTVPLDGAPLAKITDWLPPGDTTAWLYQKPAADIASFGTQMAADPAIAACAVARVWNYALGKTDIVDTLEEVPNDTIQAQIDAFTTGGFKLKTMIRTVFTSDDFIKF